MCMPLFTQGMLELWGFNYPELVEINLKNKHISKPSTLLLPEDCNLKLECPTAEINGRD